MASHALVLEGLGIREYMRYAAATPTRGVVFLCCQDDNSQSLINSPLGINISVSSSTSHQIILLYMIGRNIFQQWNVLKILSFRRTSMSLHGNREKSFLLYFFVIPDQMGPRGDEKERQAVKTKESVGQTKPLFCFMTRLLCSK